MRVEDIDAWLLQETYLEDDDLDTNIGRYPVLSHNSVVCTTKGERLFQGIAIILPQVFPGMESSRGAITNYNESHW
jgi:hypothetical protein